MIKIKFESKTKTDNFKATHKAVRQQGSLILVGDLFELRSRYYINNDETISIKSSNVTGKIFKKLNITKDE